MTDNGAHSFTEGAFFEEEKKPRNKPHVNFVKITPIEKSSWIKIYSEADLPDVAGSILCWVFFHGKVQTAIYQCKYFEVKAEYGLYPWNLVEAYQIIPKPEAPSF